MGGRSYEDDPEQGFHVKRAGAHAAIYGTLAVPALGLGYLGRKPIGHFVRNRVKNIGSGLPGQARKFASLRRGGESFGGAAVGAFGTLGNTAALGAALGGLVGGYMGSRDGDTVGGAVKGTAVGAAAGVGLHAARRTMQSYQSVSKIPVIGKGMKLGVLGAAVTGAYALGHKMSGEGTTPQAVAAPSLSGAIEEYGEPGDYKDRMAAMGATGDIVLGSHRGRHGR